MQPIAPTPEPPYYAVIFTSTVTDQNEGCDQMARRMVELAAQQTRVSKVERDYGL